MDDTDRKILDILEKDGRASYTEIADEIGVSEGTVRNRVERMADEEVIEKFTVETSLPGNKAIVMVKVSTGISIEDVITELFPGMKVNEVTGEYDLVLEFKGKSSEELNSQLDSIREIEGVEETKTYPVLKSRRV